MLTIQKITKAFKNIYPVDGLSSVISKNCASNIDKNKISNRSNTVTSQTDAYLDLQSQIRLLQYCEKKKGVSSENIRNQIKFEIS